MNDLQEKVVLITGAGKGSGRSLAQALAARGARMALNDISPVNLEPVVEQIVADGGYAKAYVEDVAKKVGAQHLINQVEDDFGRLNILIYHAAVEPHGPLLDMDEWDWHRVLDVNLTGAFLMTQSAGRLMRLQGSGVIVHLITGAARDQSPAAAFLASMDGLQRFSREAERELSPHGIQVYWAETDPERIVGEVFKLLGLAMEAR